MNNFQRAIDYEYDKTNPPLLEVAFLLNLKDAWEIKDKVRIDEVIVTEFGDFHCREGVMGFEDLQHRAYVMRWGEDKPQVLFLDTVGMITIGDLNPIPIVELNEDEPRMYKRLIDEKRKGFINGCELYN